MRAELGIVGAGPAGARLAELAARGGMSVLLFDPRAPWEKPCGGGVTVRVGDHFPELFESGPAHAEVRQVRVVTPDGTVTMELPRPFRLYDRRTLGEWQLERAVASGARFLPARVVRLEEDARGWRLVDEDRGVHVVEFLAGADGATSVVRRVLTRDLDVELHPTRGRFVSGGDPGGAIEVVFFGDVQGYAWWFPRPDRDSVGICDLGGGLKRSGLEARLGAAWPAISREAEEYGHPLPVATASALRRAHLFGRANIVLLGDAAGLLRGRVRCARSSGNSCRARPRIGTYGAGSLAAGSRRGDRGPTAAHPRVVEDAAVPGSERFYKARGDRLVFRKGRVDGDAARVARRWE
ncbi:MAG: hypothetical protein HY702_01210 [Gemmatimonadetes bacterium]|nr:hypothetical protein [Gemmatimonadota bacterium]